MKLIELRDRFLTILGEAQKHRDELTQWVEGSPAWVLYERTRMLEAVNAVRLARGKPFVTEEDVLRVENQAFGHVDYSRKFSLYCAKLALKD
jgi:hypothetical protein